jgi:hypothetical protein
MKPNFGCGWAIGLGIAILTSSFSPIIASAAQGGATKRKLQPGDLLATGGQGGAHL